MEMVLQILVMFLRLQWSYFLMGDVQKIEYTYRERKGSGK